MGLRVEPADSSIGPIGRRTALIVALVACSIFSVGQDQRGTENSVEAFVPSLTPIGDVLRPEWPESFARDGIQGAVQMLVTIDQSGRVTNVEALTGPVAMRDLAIPAVRTWHFNPVIRSGHAVAAYTTALLTHYIRGTKHSFDDLKDRTAYAREEELQERFPRSDAQILADLEQDSVGRTGRDRVERLTPLAKAGWRAGDTNKVLSYAGELLNRVGELQTAMERNGAINDGNTILGLVALQRGDVEKANGYLLESANVTGTRVIFNPSMALADALLRHGEKAAVLEYINLCRTHWLQSAENLARWANAVSAGETPDFGFDASVHP